MEGFPPEVKLEDASCVLGCDARDEHILTGRDRLHDIPGLFKVVRCAKCGLMRTNPRPTAATIGSYYPDDYSPYLTTAHGATTVAQHRSASKRWLRQWLGLESRQLPPIEPGHLLEIGCASGSYLEMARAAGWTVEGVEFSGTAARQTAQRGIPVQTGPVESARPPVRAPDVIAAWMVIEHLHQPVVVLSRLREWIAPEGYLIGSVPVHGIGLRLFGSASYDLHLPAHLYHFSVKTLEKLLSKAGWRIERITWQRNPYTFLWSLEYKARDWGLHSLAASIKWVRTAPVVSRFRALLGVLLGATRQSGRIEFWARPATASTGSS